MDQECETFEATLIVQRAQIKELLRAFLLSILFQRNYPTTIPTTMDVFDITFSIPDNPEMKVLIDERVEAFSMTFGSDRTSRKCSLAFTEKKARKGWFGKAEENVPWEKWNLTIQLATGQTERERLQIQRTQTIPSVQTALFSMLRFVNRKKDHVPLLTEATTDGGGGNGKWDYRVEW